MPLTLTNGWLTSALCVLEDVRKLFVIETVSGLSIGYIVKDSISLFSS